MTHHLCIHCVPSFWKHAMKINDASTTSAISHVPAFRMKLTEFQGIFGVMRRMRNISLLCCLQHTSLILDILDINVMVN